MNDVSQVFGLVQRTFVGIISQCTIIDINLLDVCCLDRFILYDAHLSL